MTRGLSTNNYGPAKFIVDASAANGTHTTIAAALTDASSGDTIFVRQGTYTENLTLKAGVDIVSFPADRSSQVKIKGKLSASFSGGTVISNIALETNGDYILALTGSSGTYVTFKNCYLSMTNATGINYTSSSGSSAIYLINCSGDIGTTGITLFTSTANGPITIRSSHFTNTGASTTASTNAASTIDVLYSDMPVPITTSSTSACGIRYSVLDTGAQNVTCLTLGGSGDNHIEFNRIRSGTASAISVSASCTAYVLHCEINSSNANIITGAGTVYHDKLSADNTGKNINTTTQASLSQVLIQTFTSNGTYTPTAGMKYCIIECIGGGGAGGGAAATGAGTTSAGGGGGAGEYARGVFAAFTIGTSQSVTVPAAATGVSGTTGNTGGTVVVGSTLISAVGGSGGTTAAAAANTLITGAAGGTGGTGGSFRSNGSPGYMGFSTLSPGQIKGGAGGNSQYGAGGTDVVASAAGNAASNYGAGGSGAVNYTSQSARAGGNGSAGIVIITEYLF